MLRFLVDENVRHEVAVFLTSCGYDIARPKRSVPDDEVAALAQQEARVILTHDLGFSNTIVFPPHAYAGIIVVRILPPTASLICAALERLLAVVPEDEFSGRLFILEAGGFRVYKESD